MTIRLFCGQIEAVRTLAQALRQHHHRGRSWRRAAEALHVLDPDGQPNPGEAHRIAHGYMPSDEMIERLLENGAIQPPAPRPMRLDGKQNRAIQNALRERRPLPPPTQHTINEFYRWLNGPHRRAPR